MSLSNAIVNKSCWPSLSGLRLGALNICSLPNKITEVTDILYNSGSFLHIFGVCESRCLEIHKSQVRIKNYSPEHVWATSNSNKNLNRVGICVYIYNEVVYKRRCDLEHRNIECIWLKINLHCRTFLIGYIYRNGKVSHHEWLSSFSDMMDKVCEENCNVLLLGDLNIDLLVDNLDWVSLYSSFRLHQLVNVPTRVTKTTSTLIDHIYTNNSGLVSETCVPVSGVSDHYPTLCTLNLKKYKVHLNEHRKTFYRNFRNFDERVFVSDLLCTPFDNVFALSDPTEAFTFWSCLLSSVFNKHAPFIEKRIKRNPSPPWLTQSIRQEMYLRDSLKKERRYDEYKSQRNKVKSLIRLSKKEYINSLIENKSDSASIWKAIKLLTNSSCSATDRKSNITVNDFNAHFTSVSKKLKDKLPPDSEGFFSDCLTRIDTFVKRSNCLSDSFYIPYISVVEVLNHLKALNVNKSVGLDNFHARLLKIAAPVISVSLTYIYNLFICKKDIPLLFKCAKCIPIFKSGAVDDPNNFRPISILSVLCKPFEKHINYHLSNFFESCNLFHFSQSAFRKSHSCETALLNITEPLYSSCNSSEAAGLVFVDFSKAFDMIDHEKLLVKLKHYCIAEPSIELLRSYLTNRMQSVCLNSSQSELSYLSYGVPQGSILGPLLFSIYINDLPLSINSSLCHLFADDTTLVAYGDSVASITSDLSYALQDLYSWCVANSMLVNPSKSECMLVCTRQKRMKLNDTLSLTFDNIPLPQVSSHRLLGVVIDRNLTWSNHTALLSNRLASKVYQLNCIKNFINLATRKLFYHAYIQPCLDYCSSVWGHCCKTHLIRLNSLQKRSFKLILKSHEYTLDAMAKMLNIQPLNAKIIFNDCILLHKIVCGSAPSYLSFLALKQPSQYFSDDLRIVLPFPNMDIMKMSFAFNCASSWNKLPVFLRRIKKTNIFRRHLLNHFGFPKKVGIG